ncbi:MAG: hypothetical protein ABSG68_07445 [Thermoguttaceae bacterium]|jgi:hypothetical protein
MDQWAWIEEFPGDITVCNAEGIILLMNAHAARSFADDGGKALVGSNLLNCHPEPSRTKLEHMLQAPQANIYFVEKAGRRKLVYQSPWSCDGKFAGIVEFGLPMPAEIPTLIRTA